MGVLMGAQIGIEGALNAEGRLWAFQGSKC